MNISPDKSDGHDSSPSQESDGSLHLFSDTAKRALNFSDEMDSPLGPTGPNQKPTSPTQSDGGDPLFPDPTAKRALDFTMGPTSSPYKSDGQHHSTHKTSEEKSDGLGFPVGPTSLSIHPRPDGVSDGGDFEKEREEEGTDGLDPLFSDTVAAKSDSEFTGGGDDEGGSGVEYDFTAVKRKKRSERSDEKKKKKKAKKAVANEAKNAKLAKTTANQERKERLAQQADFQRVMRERKCVGFKPIAMVEKPISSVLEKIRQRKREMLQKVKQTKIELSASDGDSEEDEDVLEIIDSVPKKAKGLEPVLQPSVADTSRIVVPNDADSDDKPCSSDEQAQSKNVFVEGSENLFRAPLNDTQDLFSDSQTSESQEHQENEEPSSPLEDVAPSLPSLNLKLEDSVLPDDISSDEEDSDKENDDPGPQPQRTDRERGVMDFLDEEALEDDSDDELLHREGKDEEDDDNDDDEEEHCDYIARDYKEKPVDQDRRNQLHQKWIQQQEEAGTEDLLQRLKYGKIHKEPSFLSDEDDDKVEEEDVNRKEEEKDESDEDEDGTEDHTHSPHARITTKKLKQMIPQMFNDEDDVYVSSEDEETERSMSRFQLLQKAEPKQLSKFLSPAEDETSKMVFSRIRKLNVAPDTKKRAKITSFFDALVTKGSSSNSSKPSFLQRASSLTVTSSHSRSGSGTGRTFIFGRDDSRSSLSVNEDSLDTSQNGGQEKRSASASAKFTSSQPRRGTQQTEPRDGKASGTSLLEILKRSSIQTGCGSRDNRVDHQSVFAAFKPVKKQIKVDGRPY